MSTSPRPSRRTLRLTEGVFSLAFMSVVFHHVSGQDFRPLAALLGPVLILYYGLASLLFVRGKALAAGPWQRRSLIAAERATQATVWHLLGIVVGVGAFGLLRQLEAHLGAQPSTGALLLAFAAPFALMQAGLLSFLRSVWTVLPDLTRTSSLAVRRRIVAGG